MRETSAQALASVRPHLPTIRAKILRALERRAQTCDSLEVRLKLSHQTVSSALNWLNEKGKVRDSGYRRPTRSGRPAIVWEVVE